MKMSKINIDQFIVNYSRILFDSKNLNHYLKSDSAYLNSDLTINPYTTDLSGGIPGILILGKELCEHNIMDKNQLNLDYYIEILLNTIKSDPVYDISLFSGLSGIGASLVLLERKDLINVINQINDSLLSLIDFQIENYATKSDGTKAQDYDLMYGLSGTLSYLCLCYSSKLSNNFHIQKIEKYIKIIQRYFIDSFYKDITINHKIVKPWFISVDNQMTKIDKHNYPFGNYNLSMSHGISGIVGALCSSIKIGVLQPDVESFLNNIVSFIIQNSYKDKDGILAWPLMIKLNQNYEICSPETLIHNNSWCYGSPGILLNLYNYSILSNDYKLKKKCLNNFQRLTDSINGLPSPSICHGYSGLLLILNSIKEINLNPEKIYQKIFSFLDPNLNLGFSTQEFLPNSKVINVPDTGILTGISGILLCLMDSLYGHKTNWIKLFNI